MDDYVCGDVRAWQKTGDIGFSLSSEYGNKKVFLFASQARGLIPWLIEQYGEVKSACPVECVSKLQEELRLAKTNNADLLKQIDNLAGLCNDKYDEIAELRDKNGHLDKQHKKDKSYIEYFKDKCVRLETSLPYARVEALQLEVKRLKGIIHFQAVKLASHTEELAKFKGEWLNKYNGRNNQISRLESMNTTKANVINGLNEEIAGLNQELEDFSDLKKHYISHHNYMDQAFELEKERQELRFTSKGKLKARIKELEKKLKSVHFHIRDIGDKVTVNGLIFTCTGKE